MNGHDCLTGRLCKCVELIKVQSSSSCMRANLDESGPGMLLSHIVRCESTLFIC